MSPGRNILSASHPARPRPAARPCALTRPARGMSGFWIRQVLAFSLHRILLVRDSGETLRRRVFDALGGTRDACLLGELFCRRPVLPGPAAPPDHAPRPDPPVVCLGFRFDKFCTSTSFSTTSTSPLASSTLNVIKRTNTPAL